MRKMTEDDIEILAINLLKKQGFKHFYGPDISLDGSHPLRKNHNQVLLTDVFKLKLNKLNPHIPPSAKQEAVNKVINAVAGRLIEDNESFHHLLAAGVNVQFKKNNEQRGDYAKLIDFENPENNTYHAVNQFTVIEDDHKHRPDIVLFVNGLPLAVIELKNPIKEQATIQSAYKQIQTYKKYIPSLFTYNSILIISDGLEAKAGALTSGLDRFMAWKSIDGKKEAVKSINQMEILIKGMLNKKTLLDLIQN